MFYMEIKTRVNSDSLSKHSQSKCTVGYPVVHVQVMSQPCDGAVFQGLLPLS